MMGQRLLDFRYEDAVITGKKDALDGLPGSYGSAGEVQELGLSLCEEDIQKFLDRRKPGQSKFTTQRRESDTVEILSGVFEGKTTGTPISIMVWNKDQHSADYSEIASYYRPGQNRELHRKPAASAGEKGKWYIPSSLCLA